MALAGWLAIPQSNHVHGHLGTEVQHPPVAACPPSQQSWRACRDVLAPPSKPCRPTTSAAVPRVWRRQQPRPRPRSAGLVVCSAVLSGLVTDLQKWRSKSTGVKACSLLAFVGTYYANMLVLKSIAIRGFAAPVRSAAFVHAMVLTTGIYAISEGGTRYWEDIQMNIQWRLALATVLVEMTSASLLLARKVVTGTSLLACSGVSLLASLALSTLLLDVRHGRFTWLGSVIVTIACGMTFSWSVSTSAVVAACLVGTSAVAKDCLLRPLRDQLRRFPKYTSEAGARFACHVGSVALLSALAQLWVFGQPLAEATAMTSSDISLQMGLWYLLSTLLLRLAMLCAIYITSAPTVILVSVLTGVLSATAAAPGAFNIVRGSLLAVLGAAIYAWSPQVEARVQRWLSQSQLREASSDLKSGSQLPSGGSKSRVVSLREADEGPAEAADVPGARRATKDVPAPAAIPADGGKGAETAASRDARGGGATATATAEAKAGGADARSGGAAAKQATDARSGGAAASQTTHAKAGEKGKTEQVADLPQSTEQLPFRWQQPIDMKNGMPQPAATNKQGLEPTKGAAASNTPAADKVELEKPKGATAEKTTAAEKQGLEKAQEATVSAVKETSEPIIVVDVAKKAAVTGPSLGRSSGSKVEEVLVSAVSADASLASATDKMDTQRDKADVQLVKVPRPGKLATRIRREKPSESLLGVAGTMQYAWAFIPVVVGALFLLLGSSGSPFL